MPQPGDAELVHVTLVQNDCQKCLETLIQELRARELPFEGAVGIVPRHWLSYACPHGNSGLRFKEVNNADLPSRGPERAKYDEVECEPFDRRIDATKDIGYAVRETGGYGSHPMHDDFDDESDPDGS